MKEVPFNTLVGKTILKVLGGVGSERLVFFTSAGVFQLYHDQDCCESVRVEDIEGRLEKLVGHTIRSAEETSASFDSTKNEDPICWTFYRITTDAWDANTVIRWFGTSNGYYSTRVDFVELDLEEIQAINEVNP